MRFSLRQRRKLLERIVRRNEARYGIGATAVIEVVGMERGHDEVQLTNTLQRYEALGYEGVIAKNPDMPYILAERNLDVSIKLKPDYFDGRIQDVNVLILGAKFSSSRGHRTQRAEKLSSFLIGVRASDVIGALATCGMNTTDPPRESIIQIRMRRQHHRLEYMRLVSKKGKRGSVLMTIGK